MISVGESSRAQIDDLATGGVIIRLMMEMTLDDPVREIGNDLRISVASQNK